MKDQNDNLSNSINSATLLDAFSPYLDEPLSVVREWQSKGGKIAGYLSNNLPLEILHAAGVLPLHLTGDPEQEPVRADEFMEPAFDPVTRSIFNKLLQGEYDFLDFIALPRSNDAQQRLYYYICELRRSFPEHPMPPVTLVDLLHTLRPSTATHNVRRLKQFVEFLEVQTQQKITDEKLQNSIEVYNLSRELLSQFTALRSRSPQTINSVVAASVYQAARSMPVESFNQSLTEFLSRCHDLPEESGKRILWAGNGLDYPGLHQLIDSEGATVVGEYHAYGNHFLCGQIATDAPPLEAISSHYQRDTRSCRSVEIAPQELVVFARQQKADAVLCYYLLGEEAWTWHLPKQKQALADAGIPSLIFYDQPYAIDKDLVRAQLQKLLQTL